MIKYYNQKNKEEMHMLRRRIFNMVVCMLMITAMMLSGCGRRKTTNQPEVTPFSEELEENIEPEETEAPEETTEPDNRIIIDTQSAEIQGEYNGYYYQQLSIPQKVVFTAILANISVIQEEYIGFTGITCEDFDKVLSTIEMDSYYYGVSTYWHYEENQILFIKIELRGKITEKQKIEVEKEADSILGTMESTSQEETIIQIYDWCASNIMYDETKKRKNTGNLYGALIERNCICVGYAKAFSYLCNRKGIYTICVSSDTHMWNYLLFNNKWYAVDPTGSIPGTTSYLMQGKEILNTEDYVPDERFIVPELANQSLYPEQGKAKETIKALQKNIKACDDWLEKIDEKRAEIGHETDEFGKELYEDIYQVFLQIKELATQIVEDANNTLYYRYLNTKYYEKKNKRINDLIKQVNEYDW